MRSERFCKRTSLSSAIAGYLPRSPSILSHAAAAAASRGPSFALRRSIVSIGLVLGGVANAAATAYTVTSNLDDGGPGTLRSVITAQNYYSGNTIQFDPSLNGSTITLQSPGQIPVKTAMTIIGPGAGKLTISGNNASRIFQVFSTAGSPPSISISGLTLTAGNSGTGGAVYAKNVNLNLQDIVMVGNHASIYGGAFYAKGAGTSFTLANTTVQTNTAQVSGGGIASFGASSVQITGSVIDQNQAATGSAGGLLFSNVGSVGIARSLITGNHAHINGGGLTSDYSPLQISYSTVSGNLAGFGYHGNGGGFWVHNANATFTGNKITGNGSTLTYKGGGIYMRDSRTTAQAALDVERSTISGNTAFLRGGGIDVGRVGSLTVGNSLLSTNTASAAYLHGGGALALGFVNSTAHIHDSTIYGNFAYSYGGGIDIYGAAAGSASTLTSLTIVGNSTHADASNGVRTPGIPTLDNCILAGNSNATITQDLGGTGTFNVHFSLIKAQGSATFTGGSGNNLLGIDPDLAPLAVYGGPTLSMLPNLGSPVLAAGDSTVIQTTDQRGLSRKVGGLVDVGAVERQHPEDVIFRNGFEGP